MPVVCTGIIVFSNTSKPPVRPTMPSRYWSSMLLELWNKPLTASLNSTRLDGFNKKVRSELGARFSVSFGLLVGTFYSQSVLKQYQRIGN